MINPATIFSKLGNSSSLLPIGVKDVANSIGITSAAYITGKEVEGKDRFIDEFGSQTIWLGGIPFYKKIIDLTLYKIAKYNPKIDIRILKDKEILKKAITHAPTEKIRKDFAKIAGSEKNTKVFKGLAMAKFIISTALTLASYWGLTSFRHKHTEKNIIAQIKKEENQKKVKEQTQQQIGKKPSFGSLNINTFKDFMFNPVKNMMIVDGGITTERLGESRNPQDFMGYVVKEGGFWMFMYFLGPAVQKFFENRAAKSGKPIDLDIRVLQHLKDEHDKKTNSNFCGEIKKALEEFNLEGKTDAQIYEMLFEKGEKSQISKNLIVQMAHKSDIIKTIKETNDIDTQHYIDIEEIKGIKTKICKLLEKAPNKEGLEEFFKKIINLKRASIAKNILASICALGIIVPGIMVAMRFMNKDNKDFQVKKQIKERLIREQAIAKN